MLKKIAWNTFKNTGNIDTMMELLEVNNIENGIIESIKDENDIEKTNNKNLMKENQDKSHKNNIQM